MKKAAVICCSFLAFLLPSCDNRDRESSIEPGTGIRLPLHSLARIPVKDNKDKDAAANGLRTNLQGLWGIAGDENALFVIMNDRIIYPEIEEAYKYYWKKDSITVQYKEQDAVFFVSMPGPDTLILTGSRKRVYVRFKGIG